jgi:PAS domain S-box-containing protein
MRKKAKSIPSDLLYEAIVDSSDDAIVSKDLDGMVMSWNKGAERIFGYSAEEMIGQSIIKLLPPERLDEEKHILAKLQRRRTPDPFRDQTTAQERQAARCFANYLAYPK